MCLSEDRSKLVASRCRYQENRNDNKATKKKKRPSTFRLRLKRTLCIYPTNNYSFRPCAKHNGDCDGSLQRSGLVCEHWMIPMLWSGGRADKISNKLAGDVACLGGSMVEHQPRLLGFRVQFPARAFVVFSVSAKASLPISLSLPSLSLALNTHSSHLSQKERKKNSEANTRVESCVTVYWHTCSAVPGESWSCCEGDTPGIVVDTSSGLGSAAVYDWKNTAWCSEIGSLTVANNYKPKTHKPSNAQLST